MATPITVLANNATRMLCAAAFSICLSGCGQDFGSIKIDGPYILLWIDNPEDVSINYDVGNGGSTKRVSANVVAYGANSDYITAYRENVGYYYIDRSTDDRFADTQAVMGPLSKQQFDELTVELNLPPLRDVPRRF